ncbi:serine--tRNA ligase, partial [Cryobacterium sp. 5I3]|nr:serine--tRNA ligase [Cryobacterium sp. 5I3]
MIDPVLLRENPDLIKRSQKARGASVEAVDAALAADTARRTSIKAYEDLRAAQNQFGKQVAS